MATPRALFAPGLRTVRGALLLGMVLATCISVIGTGDLENYEHSFFSLNRGTQTESVTLLGQPVFTLDLGLGVRLPLHGNLGASPASIVAPFVPEPLTFWLMFVIAFAGAILVLRYGLDPICGPRVAVAGALLAFVSIPLVNYTIIDDWPETALTYCAVVVCACAPFALFNIATTPAAVSRRRFAIGAVLALTFSAVSVSHPGYWPILAAVLVCAAAVNLFRPELPLFTRVLLAALLGAASAAAVGFVAPDILREMQLAATSGQEITRSSQGPEGDLLTSNIFALTQTNVRSPFTLLILAIVAALLSPGPDQKPVRMLTGLCALVSILFGLAASHLGARTSALSISAVWALRDPALMFAVVSGAFAFQVRRASFVTQVIGVKAASATLVIAALLGPAAAVRPMLNEQVTARLLDRKLAPRGTTAARTRLIERGAPLDMLPARSRIAFWPSIGASMRNINDAQSDFPDGGYVLVTASTKQRTMAGTVIPNVSLFSQSTYLREGVLCDPAAIGFLQLKYLLASVPRNCGPWHVMSGEPVDGWLVGHMADLVDTRVRALPREGIEDRLRRLPAFGEQSEIAARLRPVDDTSVMLGPREVVIRLTPNGVADGLTYLLPVAYDSAWRASSGTVEDIAGLVAVARPATERVLLTFEPDATAISRVLGMVLAQLFACLGLVGLAAVPSAVKPVASDSSWTRRLVVGVRPVLGRITPYWPHALFAAVALGTFNWRPQNDTITAATALLLPLTAVLISLARHRTGVHDGVAGLLVAGAVVQTAAGGSLSPAALHDPPFWAIVTGVALGGSIATRRWGAASRILGLVAGATAAIAVVLPAIPDLLVSFPSPTAGLVRESLQALSLQFGSVGTAALLLLWIHGIAVRAFAVPALHLSAAIARGGLIMALLLVLMAAASMPRFDAGTMVVLGALIGLAERRSSQVASRAFPA